MGRRINARTGVARLGLMIHYSAGSGEAVKKDLVMEIVM